MSSHYGNNESNYLSPRITPFEPPSQQYRVTSIYTKQPFKQSANQIKPQSRAPYRNASESFMMIAPNLSPYSNQKPKIQGRWIDPSEYLLDETAYAMYQLNQTMKDLPPIPKQNQYNGSLRTGKLKSLDPVNLNGPSIEKCKGLMPDRRGQAVTSAIARRGLLVAILIKQHQNENVAQEKSFSSRKQHRQASKNARTSWIQKSENHQFEQDVNQSVHQTSIASEEESEQSARIKKLEEDILALTDSQSNKEHDDHSRLAPQLSENELMSRTNHLDIRDNPHIERPKSVHFSTSVSTQ